MPVHPLYVRWRILENAIETVVLATATGDADLELLARDLAAAAAERLEITPDLLERMENDHALIRRNGPRGSAAPLYLAGTQSRLPN